MHWKKKLPPLLSAVGLAGVSALLIGAGVLRPLSRPLEVKTEEVSLSVCVEMDSFKDLKDLIDRASVIAMGEYTEELEAVEDQYGQTRRHAFAVQQVLKGQAPQEIVVSRPYSTASVYQAAGEEIAYQLPMPYYTEPALRRTTLLFLSCRRTQDGNRYVSVGEPWEVIRDAEGLAQTASNWINPPPDLPDTVETYAMNEAGDALYHISYPREQADREDFITGRPWDQLLEEIRDLAK